MISTKLLHLREKIVQTALRSGRDPKDITLVAVTKSVSIEKMRAAYLAGERHFGESRVQEALDKRAHLPPDIVWHFIGTLQTNKLSKAVGQFALIHSVDRLLLAKAIAKKSLDSGITTPILLQVNVSQEGTKQGFSLDEIKEIFLELRGEKGLSVQGLMTIAPLTSDQKKIRSCFSPLQKLKQELNFQHLSMGMSQDFPIAIEEGATLLRIGSAIFS